MCDDYLGFHRDQREDRMWVKTLKAGGEGGWLVGLSTMFDDDSTQILLVNHR